MGLNDDLSIISANAAKIHDFVNATAGIIITDGGAIFNLAMAAYNANQKILQMSIFNPRGAWVTGASYVFRDVVEYDGAIYMVLVDHEAGVFAEDISSGKLVVYQDTISTSTLIASLARDLEGEGVDLVARAKKTVDTVDDLDDTPPGTHENVYARCFETIGDGGFGEFEWIESSTATPVRGMVHQVTGVTTGRWIRQYSGFATPEMFGAVGDGVANDSASFVLACAFSTNVMSASKTYLITTNVLPTTHVVNIYGVGPEKSIILFNPTSEQILFNCALSGSATAYYPMFKDFSVKSTNTVKKTVFKLIDTNGCVIESVRATNITGNGSIGIDMYGRQGCTLRKFVCYADNPIKINGNPYIGGVAGTEYYHYEDIELGGLDATKPLIAVADGVSIADTVFDGANIFFGGKNGFYAPSIAAGPQCLTFKNITWDRPGADDGWFFDIGTTTPGAFLNISFSQCKTYTGDFANFNGFKVTDFNIATTSYSCCSYDGTADAFGGDFTPGASSHYGENDVVLSAGTAATWTAIPLVANFKDAKYVYGTMTIAGVAGSSLLSNDSLGAGYVKAAQAGSYPFFLPIKTANLYYAVAGDHSLTIEIGGYSW